jgi:hypothetical protein
VQRALDETVALERLQGLGQDLLAHAVDAPTQVVEAPRVVGPRAA